MLNFKKYCLHVLTNNKEFFITPYIYNGLNFSNIHYVHNYNVVAIYLPFKLKSFYINTNFKSIQLHNYE